MKPQSALLLRLPDGRLLLQRRTKDAPTNAGRLGLFGGGRDPGETPLQAARRELAEETSLDAASLNFRLSTTMKLRSDLSRAASWQLVSLFIVEVPNANFKVYEGDGAEAHSLAELTQRSDLTNVAKSMLKKYIELKER